MRRKQERTFHEEENTHAKFLWQSELKDHKNEDGKRWGWKGSKDPDPVWRIGQMKDFFFIHLGERKRNADMYAAENFSVENKLSQSTHASSTPQCLTLSQTQGR